MGFELYFLTKKETEPTKFQHQDHDQDGLSVFLKGSIQFVYENWKIVCIQNMKFAENTHGISNVISQSSKDFSSEVVVRDKTRITVRASENRYNVQYFTIYLNLVQIFNGRHCNLNFATKKN